MAQQQIAARIGGDDFQGRIFWIKAVGLFREPPYIERVCYEYDQAAGVDDVVIFYDPPGVLDRGFYRTVDAIQAKYHVDHQHAYSGEYLIRKTSENSASLLERFHEAYRRLRADGQDCRLSLYSNWAWDSHDALRKAIRESGELPESFFTGANRSNLGKIREAWRRQLQISHEEMDDFARRLRFHLHYFNNQELLNYMSIQLQAIGFQPINFSRRVNPYDDLIRKLVTERNHIEMTAEALRNICEAEGLLARSPGWSSTARIGIRSFMRGAENMEADCADFVCVAQHFHGRYIHDPALWHSRVYEAVSGFLNRVVCEKKAREIVLECHLSLAYLAGMLLNPKVGVSILPVQKGYLGIEVWSPSHNRRAAQDNPMPGWRIDSVESAGDTNAIVAILSVTYDIAPDVNRYLTNNGIKPPIIITLTPENGPGPCCVLGADHALYLAEKALEELHRIKMYFGSITRLHLFAAVPNALMFFLGQAAKTRLNPVQLYEFDFDGERGASYVPSLCLPITGNS